MPSRSYKAEIHYRSKRKNTKKIPGCHFCNFDHDTKKHEVVKVYDNFWLVKNIFPYDIWDDQGVEHHMLIVPKRHINSIGDMNEAEMLEYVEIVGLYDLEGYSVYARSSHNVVKSVVHQHTHLLKLDSKEISFMVYNKKPYTLIKK